MRFAFIVCLLAVFLGCATTSRHDVRLTSTNAPPEAAFLTKWKKSTAAELESLKTGPAEPNLSWWRDYKLAAAYSENEKDKGKACTLYMGLAQEKEFPLNELALLRSHEVCAKEARLPLPTSAHPWYRDLYLDIKLKENEDAATLMEKAKSETNLRKREQLLLKAVELARKSKTDEETAQKALEKNSPRLMKNPELKDRLSIAQDQRAHREYANAVKTYKEILKNPKATTDEKFSALKGIRQTYKVSQQKNEYVEATVNLVNWTQSQFEANKRDNRATARFHDAQVLLARTLWTESQTSQAVKTLNQTVRQLKGRYPLDEVYFILGRIDEEKGNLQKALDYYEASSKERISLAGLQDKILWLTAWNQFKLKDYAKSSASFQQMKDKVKDPADKNRASFWLGRALKAGNEAAKAETEWKQLTTEDPLGYYGMMAYRELKTDLPALRVDEKNPLSLNLFGVNEVSQGPRLTAEWLIAVDENAYVEKILNEIVEELKRKNVTRDDAWLRVTSTYARAGLYLPLFSALGSLQPKVKDQLLNQNPDLLFPIPYQDVVEKSAKRSGIPAPFIYAIIRQESAFNPEARSPVDAYGLMQLLPSLAKNLSQQTKTKYEDADDLYDPETNIALGAAELKNLMDRYKQQFILATAAYNASGSAIRGWLGSRFRSDPVEFIEEIPYEETRAYIKLVMRNYVFYQRLLNQTKSLSFPEKLLALQKDDSN